MKIEHSPDQTQVWQNYWTRENQSPSRDDAMCLFLSYAIEDAFRRLKGRTPNSAIEMGAGSGRTSRYLNERGAETGILDLSPEALKLAAHANQGLRREVRYFEADLFKFTRNEIGRVYELVWNAGVLEHFTALEQRALLSKMGTVATKNGLLLLLCPYSKSFLYLVGKAALEAMGKFPYGREVPVETLRPVLPDDMEMVGSEKSIGFLILFFNVFKLFANFPGLRTVGGLSHRAVNGTVVALLKSEPTRQLVFWVDKILSRIFGGYLLMSICRYKK